jgi:hypothetical protein
MHIRQGETPELPDDIEFYAAQEKNLTDKLQRLIAQKKAEANECGTFLVRTRGHATRVLRPRVDQLREMMALGFSIKEMVDLLGQAGVQVSYHSLRTFLMKHLSADYRASRAIGAGAIDPAVLEAELKGAEKDEIEKFLRISAKRT